MATTARAAPHRARGRAHGAPRARRARCACGVVRTGVPDGRTEVRGKRPLALLCVALRSRLCAPSPSLRAQTLRCRPSAHIEVSCCAADAQPYAWQTFRFELAGGKPVTEDITATIEGSSLVCETIARPLGITFEERGGRCVVDAVVEGSNAESADVQSGDILRMCTAILTTTPKVDELSYYSNPPSKVGASERSGCQRGWGRSFHSRDAGALTLIPLLGRKRIFTEGATDAIHFLSAIQVYLPCLFDTTDQSFERVMGALISNGELADVEGRKEEIEEIQLVLERPAA